MLSDIKDRDCQNAKLAYNAQAVLGEGPVWDYLKKCLYWVDIEGCKLHCHDPQNNINKYWVFEEMLGAIAIMTNGNLLLALESGLAIFDLSTEATKPLNVLQNSDSKFRFNDGQCDPNGNFWLGTMHKNFVPGSGNLYKIDPEYNTSLEVRNTTISNGMAWSLDARKYYYIDSPSFEVAVFDYDNNAGLIKNRRSLFKIPKSYGSPDGMTLDQEGMLWIAHWGGGCVRRWDPGTGKVLDKIRVPAPHVTSCCFGGKDFNILYITTARSGLGEKALETAPLSGGLFCITTKVAGKAVSLFKGKS